MGLAVHCTQDKFSSGINSVVGLQLINHSNNVLKIFPYQKLAQIIIHKTSHMDIPYTGFFARESSFTLPLVTPKDLTQYSERDKSLIAQHIPTKKNILQRKKRTPEINSLFQGIFSVVLSLGISLAMLSNSTIFTVFADIFLTILLILVNIYFYYISKDSDRS